MEMIVITEIRGRQSWLRQKVRRNSSSSATPYQVHFRHLGHVESARARPCRRQILSMRSLAKTTGLIL